MASNNSLKINISFKNDDRDMKVFYYLITKRSKSAYIKDLIEEDMLKEENRTK